MSAQSESRKRNTMSKLLRRCISDAALSATGNFPVLSRRYGVNANFAQSQYKSWCQLNQYAISDRRETLERQAEGLRRRLKRAGLTPK